MNFSCIWWSRSTWQTSWQGKHSIHLRNSCTRSISSCCIRHVPSAASGGRGLNGLIVFFTRKFQETSVTRSFNVAKAFIGSIYPDRRGGKPHGELGPASDLARHLG